MDDSLNDLESDMIESRTTTSSSSYTNLNYHSLDDFMSNVCSKDTNVRLDVFARLEDYLKNENSDLSCMDLIKFCDAILLWVNSSNFRISINGLTLIQLLIQRLTEQLRNHLTEIVTHVVDRLADSKEQVRLAAKNILIFTMACYTPNLIWDKLTNSFNHKLAKVKEEVLDLLEDTLNKFGASGLQLSKIVTQIVRLLSDANQAVRDKSLETLIQIYCHVGDKLRNDLKKKLIPEPKLKLIFSKFDEAVRNGEMKDEVKQSSGKNSELGESSSSTCASLPPTTQKNKMIPASRSNMASLSNMGIHTTANRPNTASSGLIGVDEDAFLNAFEAVPKIQIYSAKEVDQHMSQINDCLADLNNDWEKRVDSLKRIRSLQIASMNQYDDEFFFSLKQLTVAFTHQIKDLRSQIVREACISIAYLSQVHGNRLEIFAELAMPHLINLIQNSAKVMASSGIVAIRFIIEYTHSARLIPIIASGFNSRSKEIRRACCDFLNQLLQTWETYHLDKHIQLIQTSIKKGIADADQEARVLARKAFWSFSSHYQPQADHLLNSLDAKAQKLLQNGSQGAFGSVKSLKDGYLSNQQSNSNYHNVASINYDFMDSQNNRLNKQASGVNTNQTQATPSSRIKRSTSAVDIKNSVRSNSVLKILNNEFSSNNTTITNNSQAFDASDILAPSELEDSDLIKNEDFNFDLASKSLLFTAANDCLDFTLPKNNIKNNNSSSRNSNGISSNLINNTKNFTGSRINTNPTVGAIGDSATLNSRNTTSRIPTSVNQSAKSSGLSTSRIAYSQPGSRSTSPTPKYSYITHSNATPILNYNNENYNNGVKNEMGTPNGYSNGTARVNNTSSGHRSANTSISKSKIPTSSRNSSRESSPGRRSNYGSERRVSISKTSNSSRRLFGRQLTNNSDSEQALASAITNKYNRSTRRWTEDSDEASETSSICSERSFSSSIGGTRVTEVRDMNEAITCLSSSQWSDRRDGLVNLKNMMQMNRIFSRQEIKRLCELFSKLFHDPHVKVFTLFLDTLNEFIRIYKRDLKEWLYILLTRLLIKLGSESLSSVYSKLVACLQTTRSSFDLDLQFKILIQFFKDNTGQTSNLKVKVAVLKYLQDIICMMEAVDFHSTDDLKYAVCKIVSLTAEPKSVEIRKTSQAVLVALFNLNTPEFSLLLAELPKNIQETASRILRNHIKNFSQDNGNGSVSSYSPYSSSSYFNEYITNTIGNGSSADDSLNSGSQLSHVIKDIQNLNMNNSSSHYHYLNHHKDRLNGNKNDLNVKLETLSKDSGVQSNGDVDSDSDGAMTSSSTTTTTSSSANLPSINSIITSLSNNTISSSERLKSMKDLTELIKAGNRPECKWNENFKNILLCLFNHLDSSTNETSSNADQALALQTLMALRELLQFQYKEFSNYIELTIMKLIDKYKESPPNEFSKLVEEVICTAAHCLPPEPCARVLKPLIETADYPKNLMAIRMMHKTINQMNFELCSKLLPDLLNALLIAWDSTHSPVRKAAVFCLVSLYFIVGENLRNHLTNLSSSKIKLLNVYINREKESRNLSTS